MENTEVTIRISLSDVVAFDPDMCTGCGTCELMCSLHHEGVGGPALARVRLERDPLNGEFSLHSCRQCLAPGCYVACPLPDDALRICERTGARYIDPDECISCGACEPECPNDAITMVREEAK